jgi:phospholipase A1
METIILVPGGGGSKLKLKGQEIWPPTLTEMLMGYQRITELQDSRVKATTVIDVYPPLPCYEVYKPLQDDLNTIANNFTPAARRVDFAYDWRKDIVWSAGQLASKIASCVSSGSTSITLVAHSMGNLLARTILESGDYSSESWFDKITRYVGICGPHAGVPELLECALGLKKWISISPADIKTVSANHDYPSGYQCLPFESYQVLLDVNHGPKNFYDPAVASFFGLDQHNLDAAKNFQSKLDFSRQPGGVRYTLIAGSQLQTDEKVEYDGSTYNGTPTDDLGDSTIPIWSSAPAQLNPRVTPGDHVGILKSYPFREILYEVLTNGTLIPQLSLVEQPGVSLSLNNIIFAAHEPIEFLIIPDLRTEEISGTLQIMRVVDTKGRKFVSYQEHPVVYRGPAIGFIRSTIFAPADPGAYRITFTGSHGTSQSTAAGFIVSRVSAKRATLNKPR